MDLRAASVWLQSCIIQFFPRAEATGTHLWNMPLEADELWSPTTQSGCTTQQHGYHGELVGSADPQALPQTHSIRA